MARPLLIAALGSSFAAGPGIEPVAHPGAMRSARNYPHLLAEELGARLVDLTVSGATTTTILDEPQVTLSGEEFAPQVTGVPTEADLVTVTAGGNDLGFLGSMLWCAARTTDPTGPVTAMLGADLADGLPEPTPDAVERTAGGLARVVEVVGARTTHARVLLVDYLTILSPTDTSSTAHLFTAEETALLLRIQDALAEAYRRAADRTGAELVAVSALSRDHALGSADPWVAGFDPTPERVASSFHPAPAGMRVVAAEVARVVRDRP